MCWKYKIHTRFQRHCIKKRRMQIAPKFCIEYILKSLSHLLLWLFTVLVWLPENLKLHVSSAFFHWAELFLCVCSVLCLPKTRFQQQFRSKLFQNLYVEHSTATHPSVLWLGHPGVEHSHTPLRPMAGSPWCGAQHCHTPLHHPSRGWVTLVQISVLVIQDLICFLGFFFVYMCMCAHVYREQSLN